MSTNLKIAKAYFIIVSVSILGNILSLWKEILVANYFGITKAMDAFSVALTVPTVVSNIILSCFSLIFIPIFIKYKIENKKEANRIASIVINYLTSFLLIITVFIFLSAPVIIKYGFSALDYETRILSIKILKIISITVVFSVLASALSNILNAYEHFLWPAISNTFITISTILLMLFFTKQWGIFAVAWGFFTGLCIQFIFLIPFARQKGYNYSLDFRWNHPAIKKTLNLSLIFLLLGFISGISPIINKIMASWLSTGSVAALGYADRLVQIPMIIFSGSIAIAVNPFFSMQIAEEKIEEMKNTLATSIKMMGFIFIPLGVIMIILARPIIQILFERGAFDIKAADLTSKVFVCYSFQFFSIYANAIMSRLLLIFQDMTSIFKIVIISIILNILLNFIFIKIISPPVAGIALSSSVVCFISTLLCFFSLKRKIQHLHGLSIIKSLSKTFVLAALSGIIIFIVFQKIDSLLGFSIINQIIKISVSSGIGILIFLGTAFLLKMEEVEKIYFLTKGKIERHTKK